MHRFVHHRDLGLYPLISLFVAGILATTGTPSIAQDKKDDKKEQPTVKVAVPLAAAIGSTTKVTIRGVKLDEASDVRCKNDDAQIKLVNKGKAAVPNMVDAAAIGDTQVEIELTLPNEIDSGELPLIVNTPAGDASFVLPVFAKDTLIDEKEPNNGFAGAQPVAAGKVLLGAVEKPRDVDVFRIELAAGEKLVAEVHAARQGSPLDTILTLYDQRGSIVATRDDHGGARDSRMEFAAPSQGSYFLSLVDAHDLGSTLHVYRLGLRVE
jgi:hypothetical protein